MQLAAHAATQGADRPSGAAAPALAARRPARRPSRRSGRRRRRRSSIVDLGVGERCLDQALDLGAAIGIRGPPLLRLRVGRHVSAAARPRGRRAARSSDMRTSPSSVNAARRSCAEPRRRHAGRLRRGQDRAPRSSVDDQSSGPGPRRTRSACGRRRRRGSSSATPTPPASAISASATSRPPSERSWQAATRPALDQAAHEVAVAPLGREIDRRRRAVLAAADLAQIERLRRASPWSRRSAPALSRLRRSAMPTACGDVVDQADAADRGRRQDRPLPSVSL